MKTDENSFKSFYVLTLCSEAMLAPLVDPWELLPLLPDDCFRLKNFFMAFNFSAEYIVERVNKLILSLHIDNLSSL